MTESQFQNRVSAAMAQQCRVAAGCRIVVAVSGGADSVALLDALSASGFTCVAAHCNFHLRGDESDRDMEHVRDIARRLGVDLHIRHFDVPAQMSATGQSVEMACRELRYAWFEQLLVSVGATVVAVGHHREDQAETFMLNLLRGTGIAGLTGMAPRNGNIVRPLLTLSRNDITEYLHTRGLDFVNDSSNASSAYKRNRLRNTVLPTIERQFDGAVDGILATMSHVTDNRRLYDYAVQALIAPYSADNGAVINLDALTEALPADIARMLLFETLKPKGFNFTHIDNILQARLGSARFNAGTFSAIVSRRHLYISPTSDGHTDFCMPVSLRQPINAPIHIDISQHDISQFKPTRDKFTMYMDTSVLQADADGKTPTFTLRHYRQGDRLRPYGMTGSKLVSDIFADAKLSDTDKKNTYILTRNDQILWVIGLRASALFPVTGDTDTYLQLTVLPQ